MVQVLSNPFSTCSAGVIALLSLSLCLECLNGVSADDCAPAVLEYHDSIGMRVVSKLGNVPTNRTDKWTYNMAAVDNFDDKNFFLDQYLGRIYSYDSDTSTVTKIFDKDTSDIPAGIDLNWSMGSISGSFPVHNMAPGKNDKEVIVVFTSSTLPEGWDEANAKLPAEGTYASYTCDADGSGDGAHVRDIYRMSPIPSCFMGGHNGMETFTGYNVFYRYKISKDGKSLRKPKPFFVLENQVGPGHLGGGMVTTDDGRILWSVGDCIPSFGTEGLFPPQMISEHCGKILLIDPKKRGSYAIAGMGVRNSQQMHIVQNAKKAALVFMDIGGVTAEEVNAVSMKDILDTSTVENFGWGINATDGMRREGTFYVGPGVAGILGTQPPCEASAGSPEKGFVQPWIQFGRSDTDPLYAVSSFAVAPSSTKKLKLLFSEMNTGLMLGTDENMKLGIDYKGPATGYKIKLFNSDGTELVNGFNDLVKEELGELEDGFYRGDPRLFHMPGGKVGVFIERTGAFYELEEIEL